MKRKTKSLLTLLLTFVVAAALTIGLGLFTACGGSEDVTITLNKTTAEIVVQESTTLVATVSDGSTPEWSSSDTSIAVVRSGKVTGVAEGTATITATVGDVSATCTVTVIYVNVTISQSSASIEKGETLQLTATADRSDSVIAWSSSDASVASVDSNGLVTAVTAGTATITATYGSTACCATCEVTVTWDAPDGYEEVIFAGETDTFETYPDQWVYWNDQNWCGSNVTAVEAYTTTSEGTTFVYSGATTSCYFGYQIFYTNTTLTQGAYYKITMVVNSAVAGQITVCGTVVDLVVGENVIEVYKTEPTTRSTYGDSSISMQMGVTNGNGNEGTVIESNTFTILSVTWEQQEQATLDTLTALAITADGVVTFTDGNAEGVASYLLTFYQNGASVYTQTIVNGGTIEQSAMENGDYTVTVTAVGSGTYLSSAESESVAFTVTEGLVHLEAVTGVSISSANVITFTDSNTAGVDSYTLTVYLQGYPVYSQTVTNGGTIVVSAMENGTYTATVTVEGSGQYVSSDESEAVALTVTGGVAASGYSFKTVGLSVENDKLYYIIVGTYSTSDYTAAEIEAYKDKMLFSLRGNPYVLTGLWSGDWDFYTFDDVVISAADGIFTITIDISSLANKTYTYTSYLSFDGTYNTSSGSGDTAKYEEGYINDFTIEAEYTYTVDYNGYTVTVISVPGGGDNAYWGLVGVSITAPAGSESGSDSGSESSGSSTTAGTVINGDESAAVAAPGTMVYWNDQGWCGSNITVSEATISDHTVTLTYETTEGSCWFGVQFFYELEESKENVTLTITSTVAGDITVNGTVYTLEANTPLEITVASRGEAGADISIQMGNETAVTMISAATITITCDEFEEAETTSEPASTAGTVINGDESAAKASAGTMVYWNDQGWCGSNITVSEATVNDHTVTLTYETTEGSCWFGVQFFYELEESKESVTLTITSTVAGDITVNGTVYTLEANTPLTITVASRGEAGADISIQMGNETAVTMISAATITITCEEF